MSDNAGGRAGSAYEIMEYVAPLALRLRATPVQPQLGEAEHLLEVVEGLAPFDGVGLGAVVARHVGLAGLLVEKLCGKAVEVRLRMRFPELRSSQSV